MRTLSHRRVAEAMRSPQELDARRPTSDGRRPANGHRTFEGRGPLAVRTRRAHQAFTLLEVMIAMAMFFMAVFAILALVSQNLEIARGLRMGDIDLGTVASEIALTNRLEEGFNSGDFGDLYPGATWTAETYLYATGGLYQVDLTIDWPQNAVTRKKQTSLLLYRPDSARRLGR